MPSPYDRYTIFTPEHIATISSKGIMSMSRPEQQAIAIHSLLSDGEWHTAAEITEHIGVKSTRHVNNIMQALKVPMAIASGQQGYAIPNKSTILIA